ncbi:hypothetical protein ACFQV8_20670 [Pseudonocardia benzenivorans]
MWGIELVAPADGRTVTQFAEDVQARALRAGLIVELGVATTASSGCSRRST